MRRVCFLRGAFAASSIRLSKLFTDSHEWVNIENDVATMGITNYAQDALGKVVFVGLPNIGESYGQGDAIGEVESVKAASKIYSPVSGDVVEVNEKLNGAGSVLVNTSPEKDGWMVRLKNPKMPKSLMNEQEYKKFLETKH